MRALRLHAAGELRLHEEPDPEPGPGEVVVRVGGVGLCGSDRHWSLEAGIGDAVLGEPLVLGHEFAGVVADGPRTGERVVLGARRSDPPGVEVDVAYEAAGDDDALDAAIATVRPGGRVVPQAFRELVERRGLKVVVEP